VGHPARRAVRESDEMDEQYVRPFPRVIRIEPSGACNLQCAHCPTGTVEMPRSVMRPETFALVAESIRANLDAVKVVVLYHGGEPLLNKHFLKMVSTIKDMGVPFVKTVSNGMLLTEPLIAGIVNSGLDHIEFSLDGQSSEENNLVRRNADYATVVRNVQRLIEYRRQVGAKTPKVFISTTQFVGRESERYSGQEPEPPRHLVEEFGPESEDGIAGYKATWAVRWPHMEVLEDYFECYPDPYAEDTKNFCDHVESTITIRWNGDIVACCYDLTSRYVLGNVHESDLPSIWNNHRYRGLRRSIDTKRFIPLCANCAVVAPRVFLVLKAAEVVQGR